MLSLSTFSLLDIFFCTEYDWSAESVEAVGSAESVGSDESAESGEADEAVGSPVSLLSETTSILE